MTEEVKKKMEKRNGWKERRKKGRKEERKEGKKKIVMNKGTRDKAEGED